MISLIVAAARDGAIGKNNELPWRLPDDLRYFKQQTMGKPMIMGRKTWESLGGKPLPGRTSVVLSSSQDLHLPEGVLHFTSLDSALVRFKHEPEVMVIGGGQIFHEAMKQADHIYLTAVDTTVPDADAFFPPVDEQRWNKVWEEPHAADERHAHPFTFQRWERRKS